ncbi:hypothetical protein BH23GEM8_BH23GEM8_09010 [soil metagenome]
MWRSRLGALVLVLTVVILLKFGQEGYRWHAYSGEREQLREISVRLEDAGHTVIRTQIRADSLRDSVLASDSLLATARASLQNYEAHAERGRLSTGLYDRYSRELAHFNRIVGERNGRLSEWESAIEQNHEVVARYNRLADSLRSVAASMGEPYYDVPSPVEMAARRGLTAPE